MRTRSLWDWRWTHGLSLSLCLIWLAFAHVISVDGQSSPGAPTSSGNIRLLTASEGRAVVTAALEQEQVPSGVEDCSHAVHEFYLDAGFEYPYASSFEIYAGNENFARVKTPQAGDLITWPGHVGIIVDPKQHSFYSLVSTGLDTQDYDGPYWSSRGRPRFYRYKVLDSSPARVAKTAPPRRNVIAKKQERVPAVVEERSSVQTAASNRSPRLASERKAAVHGPQLSENPEASNESAEVSSSILLGAAAKQPTRDEVAGGISEWSNAAGSMLRTDDPWKLSRPVMIFEKFTVEKVEAKRDHGWAHLKVATRAVLAAGGTDSKRRNEKVRWELRRTKEGWEAIAPTDRTFVPQNVAVRNLAAQLARLAEQDNSTSERDEILQRESQLANLLSLLLQSK